MDHDNRAAVQSNRNKQREYQAKVVLLTIFLAVLGGFIGYMTFIGPGWDAFQLGALDLTLLALATFRLGRLIAYDRVMEPFRQFFTETLPDPTGAGDTVEPKGVGFQQSLGQLICCPICSGTWVAAGLVYLLYLFPEPTRVFLAMTAAIGAAELLNAAAEAWSWAGQHSRVMSGAPNRERQERDAERAAERQAGRAQADQTAGREPVIRYAEKRDPAVQERAAKPTGSPPRSHPLSRLDLRDAGYTAECHDETRLLKAQQRYARALEKSLSRRRSNPPIRSTGLRE